MRAQLTCAPVEQSVADIEKFIGRTSGDAWRFGSEPRDHLVEVAALELVAQELAQPRACVLLTVGDVDAIAVAIESVIIT